MTPDKPQQTQIVTPAAPTPPPVFAASPQGKKPGVKPQTSTFLGAGTLPSQSDKGFKTLTGQ